MNGSVVVRSSFWQALFQVCQFVAILGPLLLTAGGVAWVLRSRSLPAVLGCLGAVLILAGVISQRFVGSVSSVSMPYPQPTPGSSSVDFFLMLYAIDVGTFLLGVGLLWHFVRKR